MKEADPVYNDVSVVRTGGSTGAISVEFTTLAQTATPGMDYTETIGTFNWDDGDIRSKKISVPILDDAVAEDLERFQIRLSNPTGGATIRGNGEGRCEHCRRRSGIGLHQQHSDHWRGRGLGFSRSYRGPVGHEVP